MRPDPVRPESARPESAGPDWRPARRAALVAILPVTAVILLGTLGPPSIAEAVCLRLLDVAARLSGHAGWTPGYDQVQTAANVAMFVPMGALLAMGLRPSRWPLGVLVGPALSLGVEWTQQAVPGRVPDGFDVLTNASGSLIGFLAGGVVVGLVALASGLARAARGSVRVRTIG